MKVNKTLAPVPPLATEGSSRSPSSFLSSLAKGDRLRAEVRELLADGRSVLDVNGNRLVARSMVDLKPGAKVWLEVRQAGDIPRLVRVLVEPSGLNPAAALVANLARIQALAGSVDLSSITDLGSLERFIISLVTISGRQVPDPELVHLLTLLGVSSSLPSPKSGTSRSAKTSITDNLSPGPVRYLLEQLEAHQLFNAGGGSGENDGFFLFPCLMAMEHGWGEWLFSWEHGDKKEADGYRLKFFLELTSLGALSLSLVCRDQSLHGVFRLNNARAVAFIEEQLPSLESALAEKGFSSCSFACAHAPLHVMQELKDDLHSRAGENQFALVDMKI